MVNQITIRVVNKTTGKVKNVFPSIANNKQLMKTSGMEISDPQYDAKMEAFRNNRPFIENGKAKEPVKESFAIVMPGTKISEQPKDCCNHNLPGLPTVDTCKEPIIKEQLVLKPKRTRRTKAQIEQSKLQK